MPYPTTASQTIYSQQTMTLAFRPLAAGLINVVVKASAIIPPPPSTTGGGEHDPPPIPRLALRLDMFAPGTTTAAFTESKSVDVRGTTPDRLLLFCDVPAAESQLAADWTVKVTNLGTLFGGNPANRNLQESFNVTVRYQTMAGDLGKIDHIFVVMMENRSFDHMLGYLKLSGRNDVEGLTGTEFNRDAAGTKYPSTRLATTNFITDPGHGWTDVAGALPGNPPSTTPYQLNGDSGAGLPSNGGFVQNFAVQIAASRPQPPHDWTTLAPGASHTIQFRPQPLTTPTGKLGARSVPTSIPARSSSGLLGTLSLSRPGGGTPVATKRRHRQRCRLYYRHHHTLRSGRPWKLVVPDHQQLGHDARFHHRHKQLGGPYDPEGEEPLSSIMGYYDKSGVPVYDALASQFVVCDHWFASIPTDTFPNRLYAMSGGADGLLTTPSDASVAGSPPAYTRKTIFEFLQEHGADWNIFFSDLPFALVFAALAQDAKYTSRMLPVSEFVVSAATGELPAVAWIDPNFNDVPDGSDNASDDHPPGDVARGQQFIARIYDAIATSPAWSKSMLVITYDEHGGFYDHVLPAGTPPHTDGPKDDDPNLTRYGVRVPAIVVSPWVPQAQASHTIFDHTSILCTILLRFCTTPMAG